MCCPPVNNAKRTNRSSGHKKRTGLSTKKRTKKKRTKYYKGCKEMRGTTAGTALVRIWKKERCIAELHWCESW